ncbi:MAG TPA: hypothetical protein VKR38_16080 [Usitatibacter sp.]|nr:hypothetical protein [Usitatibacter sp.]
MSNRLYATLAIVAVFAVGAWILVRPPELAESAAPAKAGPSGLRAMSVAPSKLGAASVLAIDPRNLGKNGMPAPRRTLFNEFLKSKNYKALYDRLKNSPEGKTAEGEYVMYQILARCATVTDRTGRQPQQRATDQKREDFIASIPESDPQRDKRIAAFDDVTANRCAGMEDVKVTQADLNKLLSDAAAAGDAKAQALSIEQSQWAQRRAAGADGNWGRGSVTLSDAQVTQLRQIASSGDGEAMVIAGRVMAQNWHDYQVQIGDSGQPAENRALNQAFQLLACDYGYPCDDSNPRIQAACAYQGHCNAQNLADYIYYYGASPNDSQLMSQYESILRNAVQTNNWSQVQVVRGQPDPVLPNPPPRFFPPGP